MNIRIKVTAAESPFSKWVSRMTQHDYSKYAR